MSTCRRFLVIPDPAFDGATVVGAESFYTAHEEAGRQVAQPTKTSTATPIGDIAVTLAGEPETHIEGIIRDTRAGVVEDSRYGWIRAEDDPDTDLQFRQSPHVVGRHPDLIAYTRPSPAAASYRSVRPRLHALKSGDALMVWTERYWSPIWGRSATALGGGNVEQIYIARLNHLTDTWELPDHANAPIPSDIGGAGYFISAVDITQFPDTGEVIMCVATSETMNPGSADPRKLWVYHSTNDGDTWVLRHRLFFDGTIPDIVLDSDGDGESDDNTPVQDWALELLDSGRLCLLTLTETFTWSLTSDDRGASWSVTLIATHPADFEYAGHGVGASKARNGMACFVTSLRCTSTALSSLVNLWFTRDGVTFSSDIAIQPTTITYVGCDQTICISPDGWPHIYGTEHNWGPTALGVYTFQDWLWGRRLKTRDPVLSDTIETVVPFYGAATRGPNAAFHIPGGTSAGSYNVPSGEVPILPCVYGGFVGIDAIEYRGQVLMATTAIQEGTQPLTNVQPTLVSSGLVVYRLNHWQPLQEQLGNVLQGSDYTPEQPAQGCVYNRTWDCYGLPSDWGFALTAGGTSSIVVGGVAGGEGGYLKLENSPQYYTDATLPTSAAALSLDAALRIVIRVEDGGLLGTDEIAVRLKLTDSGGRHSDVSIQFERSGADVKVRLYDNIGAAGVGTTATFDGEQWVEVLYTQRQFGANNYEVCAYARTYPRDTDPDWDAPYTLMANVVTLANAAAAASTLIFGHITSGTPKSWWKAVHLHRPCSIRECALARGGDDYRDSDATNDRTLTGTGEAPLDNGIDNWMRTSRTLAVPRPWLDRGTRTAFRGEAITEGNWDYTTDYAFAASNVLRQPVLREWRSERTDAGMAMVFQSPDTCGFRPDALAVFGHNLPLFIIQFNATNSWGGASVNMRFSIPGLPAPLPDRYIHMWALDGDDPDWGIGINACRLVLKKTGGAPAAWRPHQFKSDKGGQRYYCAITETGTSATFVFRIVDNTPTVLELATAPSTVGIVTGATLYNVSVFSDRFAVQIGHHFNAVANVGYEFCRMVVGGCTHADADAAFSRIGRIVMGTAVEISNPDFERGWTVGTESGSIVVDQPTGATYTHRLRPTLRTWTADRPFLMAPEEADAVFQSPIEGDTRASTAQWYDTVRRIEGDGVACALVWDGERFIGMDGEELVQVCSDPLGLAMCHVRGLGDLENLVYDGQTENLPGGAACVPRPVSHIRGLTFRETL